MPLHDWSRATPGMFPDFHTGWLIHLRTALNRGLLPSGFYALAEQKAGIYGPDVATLTASPKPMPASNGRVAVVEPASTRRIVARSMPMAGRLVAVRHASDDRLVAAIEVVSPHNKDGPRAVGAFAAKVAGLVASGVHVAVVDILPPTKASPRGLHPPIWRGLDTRRAAAQPLPDGQPFTFAGYRADKDRPVAYINYTSLGGPIPSVPLFLDGGVYVDVPLEATYMTNYHELPDQLRARVVPPSTP